MTKLMKRMKRSTSGRALIFYLAASLFIVSSVPRVGIAAPVGTGEAVAEAFDRGAAIAEINAALAREDVRAQLDKMGYSADEINARLNYLSDFELQQIAKKAQDLNHGGSALGIIVTLLVIALLVIVIYIIWKKYMD